MLIGEDAEHLYRRAECGELHSTRASHGALMICLKSLSSLTGNKWRTQLRLSPR
jgi:hypothetical protein